jgi:hypothetical protein
MRGFAQYSRDITPPPGPLPLGEGENFLRPTPHAGMCECGRVHDRVTAAAGLLSGQSTLIFASRITLPHRSWSIRIT